MRLNLPNRLRRVLVRGIADGLSYGAVAIFWNGIGRSGYAAAHRDQDQEQR